MDFIKKLTAIFTFSDADVNEAKKLIEKDLAENYLGVENKEDIVNRFLEGFEDGLRAAKSIKGDLFINRTAIVKQLEKLRWQVDYVPRRVISESLTNDPNEFGRAIGFLRGVMKHRQAITPVMDPDLRHILQELNSQPDKGGYYNFLV